MALSIWAKLKLRKQLVKAFKYAGAYISYQVTDGERFIYPKIQAITGGAHMTEVVFTLPNGLDPKLVAKNYFAFQQVFGENIELEGDVKRFVLTISHRNMPRELSYNFASLEPELAGYDMPIVCGKDKTGGWMVYDAITEPNCLISGEPGAGKSTQLRAILTTLIQQKTADELHIYLGDLKMSEFFLFKGVAHVKSVCVYPEDLAKMLAYLSDEMRRRGELLNAYKVTHINKLPADVKPPYLLLCIDEVVMIMDDKDMKKALVQLVALGRALGMYVILSLQRPSHDILDTKIRGLLTVRMGFRTTDASNSKIIGTPGSEKISKETPGRFLCKRDELTELQAPYLTEERADAILARYRTAGWKDAFVRHVAPVIQPEELTEEDVFADVDH